jgi:DNA topoisomerase-1
VKRLEEDGIGRPSTYASIISTIERRGYVWRQGKALVPTFTAFAVTKLLKEHFGALVELGFTGQIEEGLDEISKGERGRDDFLTTFYHGGGGRQWPGLRALVEQETQIDYPMIELGRHPESGAPVVVRIGKFGPYVQVGEGADASNASVPEETPPADLTLERAIELVESRAKGPESLGEDPESKMPIYVMSGRFGPYVKRGSEFRSLGSDAEVFAVTLAEAIELFRQEKPTRRGATPKVLRDLGAHPESGAALRLLEGRYGPYVTDGTTNASLPKGVTAEDVTLERAIGLLRDREGAKPVKRGRGGAAKRSTTGRRGSARKAPARRRQP